MKLLHVISTTDPRGGGPIEGIKRLAEAHCRYDNSVEVASIDSPDASWLSHFPLPVYPLGPPLGGYRYSSRLVPWLRANAARYDAVIVNGLWQYGSLATWRALRPLGHPYFVFTHGMLDPWFKRTYPLKHVKKWLYWPWAEYRVLRDASAVLFTCDEERRLARESFWLYRCREVVVNYGTAAPTDDPGQSRQAFLEQWPALRGKRLLLFLGRLHEKKGCDLLIRAFAQVASNDPSLQLLMAGPDQTGLASGLRSLAQRLGIGERITWTGMLSGPVKWGAFRCADAFVLPSHQENFGIAVAEALACGVPVLISNKVNIWREVEADGAGLVAEDTLEGTVSLLERWLRIPQAAREQTSKRAQACFSNRFEIDRAASSLVQRIAERLVERTP